MFASLGVIYKKNGFGREWYESDGDVIPLNIDDKEVGRTGHLREQIYQFLHEFTNLRQIIDQLVEHTLANQENGNTENPAQKTVKQKTWTASRPAKSMYMRDILGKL